MDAKLKAASEWMGEQVHALADAFHQKFPDSAIVLAGYTSERKEDSCDEEWGDFYAARHYNRHDLERSILYWAQRMGNDFDSTQPPEEDANKMLHE